MKHMKLKKVAVGITLAICAAHSSAKSILVTGSIDAVSPKVTFPVVKDQQAFVSPLNFMAKEAEHSGCKLTGDPAIAKADHGNELVCLFEWTDLPRGLSPAGMEARGFLLAEGHHKLSYDISYFSGSQLEKVLISKGETTIDAVAPKPPVIKTIVTKLDTGVQTGAIVTNYKRTSGLRAVTITVEPRTFRQVIHVKDVNSCIVDVGKTSCLIDMTGVTATDDQDSSKGEKHMNLWADSDNGYFLDNNNVTPLDYTVKWDYSAPKIEAFAMQALDEESAKPVQGNVDDTYYVIDNEQAKLVVSSPHEGMDGDWWVPDAVIEFIPDPTFKPKIPAFQINGRDFNGDGQQAIIQPQKSFVVKPIKAPELVKGKYVFSFDLHQVADGKFIPKVTVQDKYENKQISMLDAVKLDREPPAVTMFYQDGKFNDSGKIYYMQDLTIVALDTFDGGAIINEARINGQKLILEGKQSFVKGLALPNNFELAPQHEYPLTVKVSDSAGNSYTKTFKVFYMPMDYDLESVDNTFYSNVQRIKLKVRQTQGVNCPLYESLSDIQKYPYQFGENQRCVLEWTGVPDGAAGVYLRGQGIMTGKFAKTSEEVDNAINYRVWMYDKNGRRALAADETNKLKVIAPPPIKMTVNQSHSLSENRFPVPLTGGTVTFARASGVNADMQIAIDDGNSVKTQLVRQRGFASADNSIGTRIRMSQGKLWENRKINLHGRYALTDKHSADENINVLFVPPRGIFANIHQDGVRQLDNANPTVEFKMGAYDGKTDSVVYNPETQGEWTVYLAKERFDRKLRKTFYDPLTNKEKLGGNGTSRFTLDLSNVGYESFRYVGVAELTSPDGTYHRQMTTNSGVYRVLKSGAIDGNLTTSRVSNRVPFSMSLVYHPKSRADNEAKGHIVWEWSRDGKTNWQRDSQYDDKIRSRRLITEPGKYYVRSTVENRHTHVKNTSEVIEILGYEVPKLEVEGVRMLHEGEQGDITLMDHKHVAREGEGIIEWSTDNKNWKVGGNTYHITGTGKRMKFYVRMSYLGNELAGRHAYDYSRYTVLVKEPKPVRIGIQHPQLIETGKPLDLVAKVALQSPALITPIESEWILPDGKVIKGNKLHYVPTVEDAKAGVTKLKFQAWAQGFKHKTFREESLFLHTWEYKFPDFKVHLKYHTRYAPMTATAYLRQTGKRLPVHMDFKYKFEPFEGMKITEDRSSRGRINFVVDKPGLYQFRVNVQDERGNDKLYTEFLEVLDPPAPAVNLKGRYSTRFMRAPLDAVFRASIKLGHPEDRIEECDWYLDDKLVGQTKRVTSIPVMDIPQGKHVLRLHVKSQFGIEHDELLDLEVAPNQKPTCEMNVRQYGSVSQVYAGCKDPDGKMSTYTWYKNGEKIHGHAGNVQLFLDKDESSEIKVDAYDDSGDKVTSSIVVRSERN